MTKVLRRGGVYMASYVFPHEAGELSARKERPVLVLQNDEDNYVTNLQKCAKIIANSVDHDFEAARAPMPNGTNILRRVALRK